MIARVTLAEIDAVRMSVDDAVASCSASRSSRRSASRTATRASTCCSRTRARCSALTFWETEEAADAGIAGSRSFYARAGREVRHALPVAARA